MRNINRDTWIQLVGMLSVVAGLLFVGLELRQSQRLALAGQQQQRAVMTSDWLHSITEQGEDLYSLISSDYSSLSDQQKKLARNIVWFQWNRIENDFYLKQNGTHNLVLWKCGRMHATQGISMTSDTHSSNQG